MTSLVVLAGVLLMTLLTGAFCGWICPFGAVQEWLRKAGPFLLRLLPRKAANKLRFLRKVRFPEALERMLRYGRFVVLFLILHGTLTHGYLVCEKYDPFKNFFHFKMESAWAWQLFGLTIGLSLLLDRWFCKYLCPMSPILEPLMALAPCRVAKSQSTCTSCGKCERTCVVPQSLGPGSEGQIATNYCTRCLDCVDDCPASSTLELTLGRSRPSKAAGEAPVA